MNRHRAVIKIGGESGQGINYIGEMIARGLKLTGYKVFAYREYPSLIKGGHASYQIDYSDIPVNASSRGCDLLVTTSRVSTHRYLQDLNPEGILIHTINSLTLDEAEQHFINTNKISVHHVDAQKMAEAVGNKLGQNVVMTGVIWQALGLSFETIAQVVAHQFADKPKFKESNAQCVAAGYQQQVVSHKISQVELYPDEKWHESLLIPGNESLALGAIAAGARAYYSYPMTPTSSIMTYLAEKARETGMLVKQAEDEITAVQMAIGSMFMGARALVATSGGGFDLMTESVSLAAMTETPLVCVIGQRPGPATGMPTWTTQGDLNLAIHAGHGEFIRCVIAVSDAVSAFNLIQQAFNIAEKWQIPVIVLTDKQIAESLFNVSDFPAATPIVRKLVSKEDSEHLHRTDRYKLTSNGVSPRWLPGQSKTGFVANSDEHLEDGTLTEDDIPSQQMMEKRMRKYDGLYQELPEPHLYGDPNAQTILVGWGSVKSQIIDVLNMVAHDGKAPFGFLHYEYIYPLKTEKLQELANAGKNLILVENNYQGQLGKLIRQETGIDIKQKLLKYDGRPFFIEDIIDYLAKSGIIKP